MTTPLRMRERRWLQQHGVNHRPEDVVLVGYGRTPKEIEGVLLGNRDPDQPTVLKIRQVVFDEAQCSHAQKRTEVMRRWLRVLRCREDERVPSVLHMHNRTHPGASTASRSSCLRRTRDG